MLVLGTLSLAGCDSLLNTQDQEVLLGVGPPRPVQQQIVIDGRLVQGSAPVEFDVDVGVNLKLGQLGPSFPSATLSLSLTGAPPGVQFAVTQPENDPSTFPSYPRSHLFGASQAGTLRFKVQARVDSSAPIGTVSPGRHVVRMRATLQLTFEPRDLSSEAAIPFSTADGELVLVIEGAPIPASPVALTGTSTQSTVRLNWAPDPAPDSYLLERSLTGTGAFTTVATLTAPVSTYNDTGLTPAATYTYRLTPRNAAGTGPAATIDVQTLSTASNGALSVALSGEGVGRVSSSPAGIDCPTDCTETLPVGSTVTLTASPAAGSVFLGWSGPADCADGQITMVAEIACTALFGRAPSGARGWRELGGALFNGAQSPVVAADPAGPIYAATQRIVGSYREVVVQRFDGAGWAPLGGAALNAAPDAAAAWHDLVVDAGGRPLAAWSELLGRVIVARFDGGSWTRIGTDLRVSPTALPGQVQIASRGNHVAVAWVEFESGVPRLALKRWDGTQWVGGYAPDVPNLTGLRLGLDAAGLATVVVSRSVAGTQQPLRVLRETSAGVWQQLGNDITVAAGRGYQHEQLGFGLGFTRLASGDPGAPVVMGTRQNLYVYARGYDGSAWTTTNPVFNAAANPDGLILDASPSTSDPVGATAIVRMPAGLGVAILRAPSGSASPRRVEVLRLQGSDWVAWTDALIIPRAASSLHAATGADGQPIVVLLESTGTGAPSLARGYRWVP
jgi:hypothetical protein